jgi:hypothetical protein
MRIYAAVLGMTAVTLLMAATPERVSAKCDNANAPGIALIVDQEVVGIYPVSNSNPELAAATSVYESESIWSYALICHEEVNPTGDGVIRRMTVVIVTADGIVGQGEAWLREIGAAQVDFRRQHGRFAANLFEVRASLPQRLRSILSSTMVSSPPHPDEFSMTGTEQGWLATFRPTGIGTGIVCQVFGGEIDPPHPELVRDVPRCSVTGDPSLVVAPSTLPQIGISQ